MRALIQLLDRLQVAVPVERLLTGLAETMTEADVTKLRSLLDFVTSESPRSQIECERAVVRGAALPRIVNGVGRRCRLLFVTGEFPNPVHGGGGRVADLIRALGRDHEIYLYSSYSEERDRMAHRALEAHCRSIGAVPVQVFEGGNRQDLRRWMAGAEVDIVHYKWPSALRHYDRELGRHHVFTYVECVSLRLLTDMGFKAPMSPGWLRLMARLIRMLHVEIGDAARLDARVVVTGRDGRFLAGVGVPGPLVVINTPVSVEEFSLPDRAAEEYSLAFVGNFRHHPNVEGALFFLDRIEPLIRSRLRGVKIYIVGADPPERLRRYDDNRRVIVTGTVADVRPYVQRSSICVAPLISGAGIRGKINQCAVLRRACVATSLAASDLVYEDGREIFIADDPAVFAERVVYLLKNPEVARRMGEAAYERAVLHYDVGRAADHLTRLHALLLSREPPLDERRAGSPPSRG